MTVSVESLQREVESYANSACAKHRLPRSYIEDVIQDGWVEAMIAEKQYDPTRSNMSLLHFIRWRVSKACVKAALRYSRECVNGETAQRLSVALCTDCAGSPYVPEQYGNNPG